MRPKIRMFIALAAAGLLAGCGGSKDKGSAGSTGDGAAGKVASSDKSGKKVYNFTTIDEPKHLDPAFIADFYEGGVSGMLFDGLVNFGYGTDINPALAEKWDISPDGKTYTFHLRDAQFSDGTTVTAEDVRYSFTRLLLPETNSDRKWILDKVVGKEAVTSGTTKELAGLKTPDSKTVVLELTQPYPALLTKLAMPNAVIIPNGAAGKDKPDKAFDTKPIGSGPWVLAKWSHDQRMEFHRNERFWGQKPKIDVFMYYIQANEPVAQQQFEQGNFDQNTIMFTIYPQWIADPAKKARMIPLQELNIYYVAFMNSKPSLSDKRVRQALSYGINADAMFTDIQRGRGERAHGPVPPGIEGYRKDIAPRPYDPEKAKKLLAEAGVKDLTLEMWVRSSDALSLEMGQAVKSDLEKIGVKVNLSNRDWPSIRQAIYDGTIDMYFNSWWMDYPDMENVLEPCFDSHNIPRQGNGAHYSNPEYDKLIADAKNEGDPKARIAKFQKAEDMIIEDSPWVPMYHRKSFYVVQPWVIGFKPALMYNAMRYTDVDIDLERKKKGL